MLLSQTACIALRDGQRGTESLVSEFNLITPHRDSTIRLLGNALVLHSGCLAYFSALYQRIDVLESKETLFAVTKRATLAAMAQYRESLVPNGVGGNRARDANLNFSAPFFPITLGSSDRKRRSLTRQRRKTGSGCAMGWMRVGHGLKCEIFSEAMVHSWLRRHSAFLTRIKEQNFGPLLGLLEVAWRALDGGAKRTMGALLRLALTGQPLSEATLALEPPEAGILAASAGLSPTLAGWSEFDGTTRRSGDPATAHLTEQNVEDEMNTQEVMADVEPSMRKGTMLVADGGLLENVDFEERLSQQI
jgi:hypothetical protein